MASALTHGFVGILAARIAAPEKRTSLSLLSGLCAALPDIDIISVPLGINRASIWFHRGFTHSFFFAFLIGLIVTFLAFGAIPRFSGRWWSVVGYFSTVTASHAILDGFTKSPIGVAFFAPFTAERYLFFIRPIPGIGLSRFFSPVGESVFLTEFCLLWLPGLTAWLLAYGIRYRASRSYGLTETR